MSLAETQADLETQITDLLDIYGQPIQFVRRANPTYDAATGAVGSTDTLPLDLVALVQALPDVILPDGQERRGVRFVVRTSDLAGGTVMVQDFILLGSFRYEIYGVTTPAPGATQFLDARLT